MQKIASYCGRKNWIAPLAAASILIAASCLASQANAGAAAKSYAAKSYGTNAAPSGLFYTLASTGMTSLSNNGTAFFTSTNNGALGFHQQPLFQPANGSPAYFGSSTPLSTSLNSLTQTVTATYVWGSLACQYTQVGSTLKMRYTVTNTTSDLMTTAEINLPEMTFPITPTGTMTDSADYADDRGPQPLYYSNFWADPRYRPGVLLVDYGSAGVVGICDEDVASMARIEDYGSDDPPAFTRYPFQLFMRPVQGGDSMSCTVSLRFAPAGSSLADVAGDLLQEYSALFPSQLDWADRRSIGALFLANDGGGSTYALNPRGWFTDPDLNVSTPATYPNFRQRLMDYADRAVAELHSKNSQGMIVWDLEGEQYPQPATYIGDPRLLSRLAPEMEYVDSSGIATVDAFFQKFRDAGLSPGLVVRPQQIVFDANGAPHQSDFSQPTKTLMDKIAYAKNRWGIKIFHIDTPAGAGPSDSDTLPSFDRGNGTLDPAGLQQIAAAYPDVLLIPEWKTTRSYAYSSPFTSVDVGEGMVTTSLIHSVYPGGFVSNLDRAGDHSGDSSLRRILIPGLANGDLLMYDGWFDEEPANNSILNMYQQAGTPPSARLTGPGNGTLIRARTHVTLEASASAATGKTISKVEFFAATTTGGAVKIGEADTAPYSILWNNVPAGAFVVSVKATDSSGLTCTPATQTIIAGPVTYSFADVAGNDDAPVTGLHAGIDFGAGKWRSNNDFAGTHGQVAYFDYLANSANGKTFTLPTGRFLTSITLTSHRANTYTISDGVNPPVTGTLDANVASTIRTNWRNGGSTITLSLPAVASSGISSISY